MTTHAIIPEKELPVWMLRAQRGVDWGVLLVLATCLLLGWRFILEPDLPRIHQHESYVLRASDYQDALLEGRLYSRWAPHALNGYGAPVYNFYPPGAPYLSALISILFTNDVILAIRIIYVLSFCVAGTSLYAFVLRQSNATTGLLAALLYVYSPYFGLTASQIIGDLNLVMAMALLPALLWSWQRLLLINGELDMLWVVLSLAGLILTHHGITLIGVSLVLILSVWFQLSKQATLRLMRGFSAILISIGISSFYWIPALLEYDLVHWWHNPDQQTAWKLVLRHLFAPIEQVDPAALQPTPQFTLGLGIVSLVIATALISIIGRKFNSFAWMFIGVGSLMVAFALLILPMTVWLLAMMTLCFAIGGSYLPLILSNVFPRIQQRLIAAIILIFLLITAMPVWLGGLTNVPVGERTIASHIFFEQQGYGIAGLPIGSAVPTTLKENSEPSVHLMAGYQDGDIDKLSPNQSAVRSQTSNLFTRSHRYDYVIWTREVLHLEILTAWFPGWRAFIDDQPIPVVPDHDTNLLTLDVPQAEQATLTVVFASTNIRFGAWIISWCSLGIVTIITRIRLLKNQDEEFVVLRLLPVPDTRLIAVVLISFMGMILLFSSDKSPISLREPRNYELQQINTVGARTDIGIEFIGYQMEQVSDLAGRSLTIKTYWRANRTLTDNYSLQFSLQDVTNGNTIISIPPAMIGGYPARGWLRTLYIEDTRTLPLPDNIIDGTYVLAMEALACTPDCISRLNFFDHEGRDIGLIYTLPERLTFTD